MPVRPFLQLYRLRIRVCAALSVLLAVLALMLTSAESPLDFGVLWHHFCGCAPEPMDVRVLLYIPTVTCLVLGIIMGIGVGAMGGAQAGSAAGVPGLVYGEMRFLLTRPVRKLYVMLAPIAISVLVIAVFPAAGLLLLLGWLRLVHAPALDHLIGIVHLIPGTEGIGDHPSLIAVLSAMHYGHYYAASVAVGLCFFALYYGQRWWIHSRHKWLRVISVFVPVVFPVLPGLMDFAHVRMGWLLMMNQGLNAVPSLLNIGLHLLFVVVCIRSCWTTAQEIEV